MRLSFRGGAKPVQNVLEIGEVSYLPQRQKDEPGGKITYTREAGDFLAEETSISEMGIT